MNYLEKAKMLGVDVDNALERFMGNEALLEKMLKKLPSAVYPSKFGGDKSQDLEVLSYIEAGDIQTAIAKAHTLKGTMGNLSVTKLYEAYTIIVNLLRENQIEKAREITKRIVEPQDKFLNALLQE